MRRNLDLDVHITVADLEQRSVENQISLHSDGFLRRVFDIPLEIAFERVGHVALERVQPGSGKVVECGDDHPGRCVDVTAMMVDEVEREGFVKHELFIAPYPHGEALSGEAHPGLELVTSGPTLDN